MPAPDTKSPTYRKGVIGHVMAAYVDVGGCAVESPILPHSVPCGGAPNSAAWMHRGRLGLELPTVHLTERGSLLGVNAGGQVMLAMVPVAMERGKNERGTA